MLQLALDPDDPERFDRVRGRAAPARGRRPQPGRDDKVVTAWNALAITALVEAGVGLNRPEWVVRAARCADVLLDGHLVGGEVRRVSLNGTVGTPAGDARRPRGPRRRAALPVLCDW